MKLVAFDLDGTLLANGGALSPAVVSALETAAARGTALAVCTGRPERIIPSEIQSLPHFRYIISASGGRIRDAKTQEVLAEYFILPQTAQTIAKIARKFGGHLHVSCDNAQIMEIGMAFGMFKTNSGEQSGERIGLLRFIGFLRRLKLVRRWKNDNSSIFKMETWFENPENCKQANENLKNLKDIVCVRVSSRIIEITAANATKGTAIEFLRNLLNVEKSQTAGFGDGGNDLSMRGAVGTLVAMGNGSDEIKKAADIIAPPVTDDGAARILEEWFK